MKNKWNWFCSLLVLVLFAFSVNAQEKGATALMSKPAVTASVQTAQPASPQSSVAGHSTFLKSSVQSLGWVDDNEIVLIKSVSLYGPNLSVLATYNRNTRTFTTLASSGVAGVAGTVIAGGAEAGAAYLFGSSIRPDNQNINSGNTGGGGVTVNNSNANQNSNRNSNRNSATGGAAQATGGTATASGSGTVTGGSTTGGTFIPPGHINNPGQGSSHGRGRNNAP